MCAQAMPFRGMRRMVAPFAGLPLPCRGRRVPERRPRLSVCIRPASTCCPEETASQHAHRQPTDPQGPRQEEGEDQDACARGRAPAPRSLHAGLDDDAEEAELRAAQDRARAADERHRGGHLHPGRGAQPPGALGGARPRRPHERPAGLPLQGDPGRARRRRRRRPQAGALEVRRQEGQQVVPRRAEITPRAITPDPVYDSQLVTQLMNRVMLHGKKSVAEQIVYGALEKVGEKTGRPPVEVLEQAVKTVTPVLEVRSRRVGGANYQVPVEVPQRRGRTLALRWLVTYARERREKSMQDKLAGEILDALEQQGNAFKRKDDMYRMAQAN